MNIMELLQLVDARLRPLVGADENALQALIEEAAAGPRPDGVPPEVEPRAVLAGRLMGIEMECRMLRERLGVELTVVSRVEIKRVTLGSPHSEPTLDASTEPDPTDEQD